VKRVSSALRWVRDAVVENLALKLLSLVFAIGFYFYIHGPQNAQSTFSLRVITLLPRENPNRVLLTQPPETVRLTLHGGRTMLDELESSEMGTVQLDLRKGTETFGTFDVSNLKLPPGVRADIEPPEISIVWDDIVTREISIQTSVTGQPVQGFTLQGQPTAEPSFVSVEGPKSMVDTIQNIRADSFDIEGLVEGVYLRQIGLSRPPSALVSFDNSSTLVRVEIGRARLERMLVARPVHVVGLPRAVVIPASIDIKIVGPPELVSVLRPEQVVPTVDVRASGIDVRQTGSTVAPVTASLEGCTLQMVPSSVIVKW